MPPVTMRRRSSTLLELKFRVSRLLGNGTPQLRAAVALIAVWVSVFLTGIPQVVAEPLALGNLPRILKTAGFQLNVAIDQSGGNGYQPVYLTFRPAGGAFPARREVTVQIRPRNQSSTEIDFQFEQTVVLPQGAALAEAVLYVPHYYRWQSLRVRLLEEGRLIEHADNQFHLGDARMQWMGQHTTMGILVPAGSSSTESLPDLRALVTVVGGGPIAQDVNIDRLPEVGARQFATKTQPGRLQFRLINENELHRSWIGYSQLDVILAPDGMLGRIEKRDPEGMAAIRDWVTAGGNLWVYGAPIDERTVQETDRWYRVKDLTPFPKTSVTPPQAVVKRLKLDEANRQDVMQYSTWQGWHDQSYYGRNQGGLPRKQFFERMKNKGNPMVQMQPAEQLAAGIRQANFGAGRIVLMQSEDPFPGSFQLWDSLVQDSGRNRLNWSQRNGISVPDGHSGYWKWLIAAVGQPPVKTFVGLNTLFVAIVGPFLYFFLRKRGRLYLLYFAAPALAIFVTGGLFLFALFADGRSTQARARAITLVDAQNNATLTQTHHTYFTVFGSGSGLKFDNQTAVYPYRHSPVMGSYRGYADGRRVGMGRIRRGDEQQQLTGVFLPTRDQVQHLTLRPKTQNKTISFQVKSDSVVVNNHLDQPINDVMLRDRQGVFWSAGDVPAGESKAMSSANPEEMTDLLDARVFPPPGEIPDLQNSYSRGWRIQSTATQLISDDRLSQTLSSWRRTLPRGCFVASTDITMEDLGVEYARLSDSVHIYFGELP